MKNVVVFGGSGFLGSYVSDELTSRGYNVKIVDIVEPKYKMQSQRYIECDIMNRDQVGQIILGSQIVYNFAGVADINIAVNEPIRTMELNVIGNLNILEACKKAEVDRFVYASSAYAVSDKGSFYGISKYSSEKLTEEYAKRYSLPITVIRYGSIYGERADYSNYIRNLLISAIVEKKIKLLGSGDEAREYIHAMDAAKLSVDVVESDEYVDEHIILTGVEKLRRRDLFVMLEEIFGGNIQIEYLPEEQKGHYRITPYTFHPTSAKKLVANPYIDFGQGLINCAKSIFEELSEGH